MMTTQQKLTTVGSLHPQIPHHQVIHMLSEALTASFNPHERLIINGALGESDAHDFHQSMERWVRDCLNDPDWQLAQRLLPLLLSRLEARLMIRRINA